MADKEHRRKCCKCRCSPVADNVKLFRFPKPGMRNINRTKKLPFTSSERELIEALVHDRPIIEDKRTHAKNIYLKKQAWDELAAAYNSQPYVFPRNSMQLKRCWENIKCQRKKELSQEATYMTGTGGGPPQIGSTDASNNIVDIICPYVNLKIPGDIDSNSTEIPDDFKNENTVTFDDLPGEIDSGLLNITENKERKIDVNSKEGLIMQENYENSEEDVPAQTKENFYRADGTSSTGNKLSTEIEEIIKRTSINIQHDQELHDLRMEREKILIEREKNLLKFEKEIHSLQLQKIKLHIELLKK